MAILTCASGRGPQARFRRARAPAPSVVLGTLLSLALAWAWFAGAPAAFAEDTPASEYQVKAAFLIHFPKYADWPEGAFATARSPIVIAVLGEPGVAAEIEEVIAGRVVNGRQIVLKRLASGTEPGPCHILFISAAEEQRSPELLKTLRVGVLTVGEADGFLDRGGIINLVHRHRRIALEVNLTAAGHAGIKISSKLLSVASVVTGKAR